MDCKYVVSSYDPVSGIAVPAAVFDSEDEAAEFARIVYGDTEIDGYDLITKVISRVGETERTE